MKTKKKIVFLIQLNNYMSVMADIVDIEKIFIDNKPRLKRTNKDNTKVVYRIYI